MPINFPYGYPLGIYWEKYLNIFNGVSALNILFTFKRTGTRGASQYLFGEWKPKYENAGWNVYLDSSERIQFRAMDGTAQTTSNTYVSVLNSETKYLIRWSGSNVYIYAAGSLRYTSGSFTKAPDHLGYELLFNIGCPWTYRTYAAECEISNIVLFQLDTLNYLELYEAYHHGYLPKAGLAKFWYKGLDLPGRDEYSREIPKLVSGSSRPSVVTPTVNQENAVRWKIENYNLNRSYFDIAAGRELWTARLVKKEYKIKTTEKGLAEKLGGDIYIKHRQGLDPSRSGFGIEGSEEYSERDDNLLYKILPVEKVPKQLSRITKISVNPKEHTVDLQVRPLQRYRVLYYDSFIDEGVSPEEVGRFRVNPFMITKEEQNVGYYISSEPYNNPEYTHINSSWRDPIGPKGLLVVHRLQNAVLNSMMRLGGATTADNWSAVNTNGVGSFYSATTGYKWLVNPGQNDGRYGYCYCTGSSFPADNNAPYIRTANTTLGSTYTASIVTVGYNCPDKTPAYLIVKRNDGQYLASLESESWTTGITFLKLPLTSYPRTYTVPFPLNLYNGTAGSTWIGVGAKGFYKQVHVFYAQIEVSTNHGFHRHLVITHGSGNDVYSGNYIIPNYPERRIFNHWSGCIYTEMEMLYKCGGSSGYNCGSGNEKYFLYLLHDANNRLIVRWHQNLANVSMYYYGGGSGGNRSLNYESGLSYWWDEGDIVKLAVRWWYKNSTTRYVQMHVYIPGAEAWWHTDVYEETKWTETSDSTLALGNNYDSDTYQNNDAYYSHLKCVEGYVSFEEIQSWP